MEGDTSRSLKISEEDAKKVWVGLVEHLKNPSDPFARAIVEGFAEWLGSEITNQAAAPSGTTS